MKRINKLMMANLFDAMSDGKKRRGRKRKPKVEDVSLSDVFVDPVMPQPPTMLTNNSMAEEKPIQAEQAKEKKPHKVRSIKPAIKTPVKTPEEEIIGLDRDLSLYDLTDMFYTYYKYHNDENMLYGAFYSANPLGTNNAHVYPRTFSRFATFRKIEATRLGAKPYGASDKIALHRPNVNLGYFRLLLDYLTLPYKSAFTDSDLLKINFNKTLYNEEHLSDKDKEELKLNSANNPNLTSNKEISQDITNCFVNLVKASTNTVRCLEHAPLRYVQDGFVAYLHNDIDWRPEPIATLDLVTEPLTTWEPSNWSSFFVIRKMSVMEIYKIIRNKEAFWNDKALRWAVLSASYNKGLVDSNHYSAVWDDTNKACGENFTVRSFFREMGSRNINVGNYYGNLLVVEGYYVNADGKVNKVIFFPSSEYLNVPYEARGKTPENDADVLFFRKDVFDSMKEAITIIPFDRGEDSLERQRGYGHELYNPIEMVGRLDSSILNFAILMGVPFTKNRNQGVNAENLEDLEIAVNGDMVDLGDRDFVETPFTADLTSMMSVRGALLQHAMSKAFLGGLDGQEVLANGRGANLANLRLIRDARIHKHSVESFAQGLKELYSKMFKRVLDMSNADLRDDILVSKLFYDSLTKLYGYPEQLLEYKEKELNPETNLPYWITLEAIRNGASHFGAAEMVLYSEIKQVFGDALDQRSLNALNRMGIKSLLGSQDSLDILGDPRDNLVTEKDQIYRATVETSTLIGSVDAGAVSFESIPILEDKDDHVAHLMQVHNPKATEIIEKLENAEVSNEALASMSEQELETRNALILKLGALANHIVLHQEQLERFGAKRDDINRLKEETNAILQTTEALMNNLQITLRALKTKQDEAQMRLQNLSPENEAEKMKAQVEFEKIAVKREEIQAKLSLANKIADQSKQQHMDKQLSKARDRQAQMYMKEREIATRKADKQNSE